MQRRDYSRVLRQVRDLPEDIGRLISQYKTPGEVVVKLLNALCHFYHVGLGFNPEEDSDESYMRRYVDMVDPTQYDIYLDLSINGLVYIDDVPYRLTYDMFRKECFDYRCEIRSRLSFSKKDTAESAVSFFENPAN